MTIFAPVNWQNLWLWFTDIDQTKIFELSIGPIETNSCQITGFSRENTLNWEMSASLQLFNIINDDVIKWKHFSGHWPFVRGSRRSPVNSPHRGLWRGALMFFYMHLNKRLSKQSRRHRAHYGVTAMVLGVQSSVAVTTTSTIKAIPNKRFNF